MEVSPTSGFLHLLPLGTSLFSRATCTDAALLHARMPPCYMHGCRHAACMDAAMLHAWMPPCFMHGCHCATCMDATALPLCYMQTCMDATVLHAWMPLCYMHGCRLATCTDAALLHARMPPCYMHGCHCATYMDVQCLRRVVAASNSEHLKNVFGDCIKPFDHKMFSYSSKWVSKFFNETSDRRKRITWKELK